MPVNFKKIQQPPGTGKTAAARSLVEACNKNEIWFGTIEDLIKVEFRLLPVFKAVLLDDFPPCRRNGAELLQKDIINAVTGKPLPVKKIVCVQWLGRNQFRPFQNYPFHFIQMPA